MSPMLEFQCWFCGEGIDRADAGALIITVGNLWRWEAESAGDDDPTQCVYAHSSCAKERLEGATMDIDPGLFDKSDENP